jgi:RNA polymerase sigma-70 factor (ECF subfamily)
MNYRENIFNGDRSAFDKIFDKYFHQIVAFVNSYIHNWEDANDIAQNSLIVVWENRDKLREGVSIEPYLFKVAKNGALDYLKSLKVRQKHAQDVQSEEKQMISELNELSLELFDVEKFKANVLKRKLKGILLTLPFNDRKIFVLSRFNNLTNAEIAEILNISPKTVEKRISLTLKILRKKIYIFIILVNINL